MTYYTWIAPLRGSYKVNMHVIHTSKQSNKNINGVGIVVRDHRCRMVRGLTGTIRGLSTLVTQLWALHLGLNQTRLVNCELVTMKTNNFNPFFEVTRLDGREDSACLWIIEQINKLLGYNPKWENRIKYVDRIFQSCSTLHCSYGTKQLELYAFHNWTIQSFSRETRPWHGFPPSYLPVT